MYRENQTPGDEDYYIFINIILLKPDCIKSGRQAKIYNSELQGFISLPFIFIYFAEEVNRFFHLQKREFICHIKTNTG